jgi:LCP family protein required for cell wall assembly
MRKRIKKSSVKWVVPVLLCIAIGSVVGVFYCIDRAVRDGVVEDTQAFESRQDEETVSTVILGDTVYRCADDIESILFLGTDESGSDEDSSDEDESYHGAMADMLMLAVINHTRQEYAVLQLNRDTITNIHLIDAEGNGNASSDMQLCTAHWYGGSEEQNCTNTVRSVSELLGGIPIDTYYCLTWEGIMTLNSVVDGVTLTIQNDFSKVDPTMAEGATLTLTDEQAYIFLRYRHGVDDGENLGRMQRHRQYMEAWIKKASELADCDSAFPATAYQKLSPYAFTSFKGSQINSETGKLKNYTYLGIRTIDGTSELGNVLGDGIDHMEFYMDEESKRTVLTELYDLAETDEDPEDYEVTKLGTYTGVTEEE